MMKFRNYLDIKTLYIISRERERERERGTDGQIEFDDIRPSNYFFV